MARKRKGLSVNGLVLLDKPLGASSNQALQKVRWLYQAKKGGHTGSLDPLATGVLPLCLGEATKFSQYFLDADKAYVTRAKLGRCTTTDDAEGETLEERTVPELTQALVESVLDEFRGDILQVPPKYSALKRDGQPLYKLARAGKDFEIESRPVTIKSLTLLAIEGDELVLDVECTKGTYIRSLVRDIGEALGCGAYVAELRRTKAGPFSLAQTVTIDEMEDVSVRSQQLLPSDTGLDFFPAVYLNEKQAADVLLGRKIELNPQQLKDFSSENSTVFETTNKKPTQALVRLYNVVSDNSEPFFLGMAEWVEESQLQPKRLVNMAEFEQVD